MANNIVVTINVQTAGAQGNVNALSRSVSSLEGNLKRVQAIANRTLAFIGIGAGIRGITALADEFINLENRVRVVTNGQKELRDVTERLYEISQRTRGSFSGTTEIFARTAVAARGLKVSQEQLLSITETLNKAIILSGAGSIEARAALIQLSQGIASGTLRGEELRSVLEQLPVVADLIAKKLGVARGNLIRIGKQGKISTQIILESLAAGQADIAAQFQKTIPTIGQGFQIMRNALVKMLGDFNNSTGVITKFARFLIFLSKHLDDVARVAAAAGIAISLYFVNRGLVAAISGIQKLAIMAAKNPMGAIVTGLTVATALLITFSDKISVTSDGLINLGDLGRAAFQTISEAIGAFVGLFDQATASTDNLQNKAHETSSNVTLFFLSMVQAVAQILDKVIGTLTGFIGAFITFFAKLPKAVVDATIQAANLLITGVEKLVNLVINGLNKIRGALGQPLLEEVKFDKLENVAAGGVRDLAYGVADVFMEGLKSTNLEDAVVGLLDKSAKIAADRVHQTRELAKQDTTPPVTPDVKEDKRNRLAEYLQDLRDQITLLKLSNREREIEAGLIDARNAKGASLTKAEEDETRGLLNQIQALRIYSEMWDQLTVDQVEIPLRIAAINQLFVEGKIALDQYNMALADLQYQLLSLTNTTEAGFARGLLIIKEEIRDVAGATETTLVNAFHSAQDALVEFVTTGKLSFGDLVNSILADLTRLLTNQLLMQLLSIGGAPTFTGGTASGPGFVGPLPQFQHGASFDIGGSGGADSQLVAFMGTPGEHVNVIPEGKSPESAPQPQFNFKNVNVLDPGLVVDAMSTSQGEKVILNVIRRNPSQIRKVLS